MISRGMLVHLVRVFGALHRRRARDDVPRYHRGMSEKCCTHRPSLLPIEWLSEALGLAHGCRQRLATCREVGQTWSFRGSKSRNKVSVGEPADGSLTSMCAASGRLLILLPLWFIDQYLEDWRCAVRLRAHAPTSTNHTYILSI